MSASPLESAPLPVAARLRLRVVGLGGSLGTRSTSLIALDRVLAGAGAAGAIVERFSIADLDAPHYRPNCVPPPSIERLCTAVSQCSAMVWSSPLYHGSVSGSFKNAVDWLQVLVDRGVPYLEGKMVGLVATAGGMQALQAVNTMEFMVRSLRGLAYPLVLPIARAHIVLGDDQNADPVIARDLDALGRRLVAEACRFALGSAVESRLA